MDTPMTRTKLPLILCTLSLLGATTDASAALPKSSAFPSGGSSQPSQPQAKPTYPLPTFPTFPSLPVFPTWPPPQPQPPGADEPAQAPKTLTVTDRQVDSISMTFLDRSDFEDQNAVERRIGLTGSWQTIANLGPAEDWTDFTDDGLQADALYCYRIRTSNDAGWNLSPQRCAYTRDGTGRGIWRAQLRVVTADVTDAGTDDSVQVRLNSKFTSYKPASNGTWVDYGQDDFERGSEFVYDLSLSYLSEIGDINQVTFEKEGTDGWCIQEVELIVNGEPIFFHEYGDTAQTCQWVDGDDGHDPIVSLGHEQIRSHVLWQSYEQPFPNPLISNAEVVSRIESMVGDSIHGSKLYWGELQGDTYVSVDYANSSTVHVDVDLAADVNNYFDPAVDMQFDLEAKVECPNDSVELTIETKNFETHADYGLLGEIGQALYCAFQADWACIEEEVEDRVQDGWNAPAMAAEFEAGGVCPGVYVNPDGDIILLGF
jgi:hypothetical protein